MGFIHLILHFLSLFLASENKIILSVGSYTKNGEGGISLVEFNPETKSFRLLDKINQVNASYQAFDLNNQVFYSVTENGDQSKIVSYKINSQGKYVLSAELPSSGADPCYLEIGKGKVYSANYSGGNVSVFSTQNGVLKNLNQTVIYDGSSINKSRQSSSHPHKVVLSPEKKYVFIPDLGTDLIYRHKILKDGKLGSKEIAYQVKAGAGPRHLVFHPNGRWAYLITEMSGEVYFFEYSNGKLVFRNKYLIDDSDKTIKGSGHIAFDPSSEFLLISNRVSKDEIVCLKVGLEGDLKIVFQKKVGQMPRYFYFSKDGNFLFLGSQTENFIQVYSFDRKSGKLEEFGSRFSIQSPVCFNQIN